jgi:glutathione S-transferase
MAGMFTLVSHDLCPYVQRAAIALAEKGVPFERVDIDLSRKPDWFKVISPLGKVPLLRVRRDSAEEVIFESAVILEFLEETEPNPLHPADPLARARHRSWIEFGSAILNAIGRFYSAPEQAAFDHERRSLSVMFDRVEAELVARQSGPWFAAGHFSLVDAVYAPIFRYFDTFDRIGDFGILGEKPRIEAWRKALSGRQSVTMAVVPDYPERLHRFLLAKRSCLSDLARRSDRSIAPPANQYA